jgi:hypothetical protein
MTYSRRSQKGFSVRVLPANTVFHDKGPGIFSTREEALALLGVFNSSFYSLLLSLQMAFGSYEVGVVQRTPVPHQLANEGERISELALLAWAEKRSLDTTRETSHAFAVPALLVADGSTLAIRSSEWDSLAHGVESKLLKIQDEIDDLTFRLYGLDDADRPTLTSTEVEADDSGSIDGTETDDLEASTDHADAAALTADLVGYTLGAVFGRWDIRFGMGERAATELPDPFAPLPVCPPGMLKGEDGSPLSPEAGRRLRNEGSYPLDVAWDGILVDDSEHPLDLERSVHAAFAMLSLGGCGGAATPSADALKHEACALLGVPTLRDFFRRPAAFFAHHLKRYSKSRRQSPIYWQIASGGISYSIWLYYHRFTQDTLYRVLRDFVEPRIQQAEREQFELESQGSLSGDAAVRLQEAQTLLQDLRILKSELDLVAPLWNPNLNDGVIINHAILWRITPYTPWQKKCKECWDKLVKGDYDWAHLAFHLWPERVIRSCTTDRSLAIAHGLEERLWQETNNGDWLPRQLTEADLQALIAEHTNPAVKNALERFLAAPPPVTATRTRASRSTRASGSSGPRRPRGTAAVVDAEATRQVLLALTAAPSDGLAKAAIADLIGVEANALTAVIKQLKDSGQIDQLGERRGARYVLSEQGRAAVASDTEVEV